MSHWSRLDVALVSLALVLTMALLGYRVVQHQQLSSAAQQVHNNILDTASSVNQLFIHTDHYFPISEGNTSTRIYNDPFDVKESTYQGLDLKKLKPGSNHGLVLQLVRFDAAEDKLVGQHLFNISFQDGDPYLRIFTDYGKNSRVESEILHRLENSLPPQSLVEIDDHLYAVDLRRLLNVE